MNPKMIYQWRFVIMRNQTMVQILNNFQINLMLKLFGEAWRCELAQWLRSQFQIQGSWVQIFAVLIENLKKENSALIIANICDPSDWVYCCIIRWFESSDDCNHQGSVPTLLTSYWLDQTGSRWRKTVWTLKRWQLCCYNACTLYMWNVYMI